jgi:hypothetical protein
MTGDVTQVALQENAYDLWHDRAVFHFLTADKDRTAYLANLNKALKPNGHLIVATFSDQGPVKCSGLDVERYDIEKMQQTVGTGFELVTSFREDHITPFGTTQNFLYAYFRRRPQGHT